MTSLGGWLVEDYGSGEVHVLPRGDFREHHRSASCWCRPTEDHEEPGVFLHHRRVLQRAGGNDRGRLQPRRRARPYRPHQGRQGTAHILVGRGRDVL
jgi:hypothetical protein